MCNHEFAVYLEDNDEDKADPYGTCKCKICVHLVKWKNNELSLKWDYKHLGMICQIASKSS